MSSNSSITISIPAYNDMQAIKNLMKEFHEAGIFGDRINYLLIDDGSQDDTAKTIEELSLEYPHTSTILHEKNKGFGDTISEAVTTPLTDYILFISGDHQFKADAAKILINQISSNADYILGRRSTRNDNVYRKVISKSYNFIITLLTNQKVNDINSIFIVKRDAIKQITLTSESAFIHAEIFLKLKKKNFNCMEVPIPHHARLYGNGSGGKFNIIIPTLIDMIKFVSKSNS